MGIGIVKTTKGLIQGIQRKYDTEFRGIRYAKAPLGELRFKRPQEVDAWDGVYMADKFGATSMQGGQQEGSFYHKEFYTNPDFITPCSEDSLFLNVWTPAKSAEEKLPVAFWVHGGAFLNGYGHEITFDGEEYCKRGVILVTINYRLGPFGFLAHPWLCAEDEQGTSGNYGIFDQIAALKWVYENISAFGGDPERITIFGQSAGAMSVQTLCSTELTGNMIKGAIFQSGGGYDNGLNKDVTLEEAMEIGKAFIAKTGVNSLEELRGLDEFTLIKHSLEFLGDCFKSGKGLPYTPNIDNVLLKAGYNRLVDNGKVKDISYMLGSTKNDIFVTPELIQKGEFGHLYYGCINWSLVQEKLDRKPAYIYYFTRQLSGDDAGAFHSSELWYMFGTLGRCWRPMEEEDYKLSGKMLDYWTNFIKTGNPNGDAEEAWAPYTKSNHVVKVLDCN
jgi:para-nitrobenzyl esterase